jgi:hypothetical protein
VNSSFPADQPAFLQLLIFSVPNQVEECHVVKRPGVSAVV